MPTFLVRPALHWCAPAAAYRAAAQSGGSALRGHRIQASWDPELSDTMVAVGRKIEEEQVLTTLLADLSVQHSLARFNGQSERQLAPGLVATPRKPSSRG